MRRMKALRWFQRGETEYGFVVPAMFSPRVFVAGALLPLSGYIAWLTSDPRMPIWNGILFTVIASDDYFAHLLFHRGRDVGAAEHTEEIIRAWDLGITPVEFLHREVWWDDNEDAAEAVRRSAKGHHRPSG